MVGEAGCLGGSCIGLEYESAFFVNLSFGTIWNRKEK